MSIKHGKYTCNGCGKRITEPLVHGTRYGNEHLCGVCRREIAKLHTDSEYADAVNAGAYHSDDEVMP